MKSINIITLGCSKNLVDSEKILGQLNPTEFSISHNANGAADIVIINTCGFIHDAKEESVDMILQYANAKKKGEIGDLIVTGCLSQRYKAELMAEIPEADAWFGVHDWSELFSFLKQKYQSESTERFLATPSHFAYLKIAEGCDRTCSFCAIPLIRGKYISQPIEKLVEETEKLSRKGVKELILIAQDLSYYGLDLYNKPMLPQLLDGLSGIEGIEWIRLHYAYPNNFPMAIIERMAKNDKICHYLDIPVQHISDDILKAMRRNTTGGKIRKLLLDIRKLVPDIALRTTLLVGFPGETTRDFDMLLDFVAETRFERLGVFTYSAEEGTRAYKLKDNVAPKTKQSRASRIMEVQQQISLENNLQKIGKTLKVLIDREEADYFVGRSQYDSPEVDNEILVDKDAGILPGNFINVSIYRASEFELYGKKSFSR